MFKTYTREQLHQEFVKTLDGDVSTAYVTLRLITPLVGGQPADDKGIAAFVKHVLKLEGPEAADAISRIKKEEVQGSTDTTPAEGEVQEEKTYGVNCLRRTEQGQTFLGTWQVRAMLKQAASRLGLFQAKNKKGSKGDLSEAMLVLPDKQSEIGTSQQIGIIVDGKPYDGYIYKKFMGSVSSATGKKSIVHDSEVTPVGAVVHFKVEWPSKRIKPKDMAAIFGLSERVGLGSVRSMEFGRFELVGDLVIETPDKKKGDKDDDEDGGGGEKQDFKPGPGEILEKDVPEGKKTRSVA